jgi:hypothetical protein
MEPPITFHRVAKVILLAVFALGAFAVQSPALNRRPPHPIPTCQLLYTVPVPTGSGISVVAHQFNFRMTSRDNRIFDITVDGKADPSASGNYRGDIGELSSNAMGGANQTVLFSPSTGKVIEIQQAGLSQIFDASQLTCAPALTMPGCDTYVANAFQMILGRAPTGSEAAHWISVCSSGQETRDQIQVDLYQSSEFVNENNYDITNCDSQIHRFVNEFLYKSRFDVEESQYDQWLDQCIAGPQGLGLVAQEIIRSPQYQFVHSSSMSTVPPVSRNPSIDSVASNAAALSNARVFIGPAPDVYVPVTSQKGRAGLAQIQRVPEHSDSQLDSKVGLGHDVTQK